MTRRRFALQLLATLLFAAPALGQTAAITGPESVAPGDLAILDATASEGQSLLWDATPDVEGRWLAIEDGTKVVFAIGTPGVYRFVLVVADLDSADRVVQAKAVHVLTVTGPRPPPDPGPTPEPEPEPRPAPIPEPGLRVLIVYETDDLTRMPPLQKNILYQIAVRRYLDQATVDWRLYDQDADLSRDLPVWQAAMARDRASVPWVVISNGRTGFEGPLPATPEEFLALVAEYEE